ncbi:hypothetical protein BD779DRAFT_1478160 [Infundibulicybe gibba]|nr:hypothetical protein BD779DRAFT_1478160 [Infundibulicybe gibba]
MPTTRSNDTPLSKTHSGRIPHDPRPHDRDANAKNQTPSPPPRSGSRRTKATKSRRKRKVAKEMGTKEKRGREKEEQGGRPQGKPPARGLPRTPLQLLRQLSATQRPSGCLRPVVFRGCALPGGGGEGVVLDSIIDQNTWIWDGSNTTLRAENDAHNAGEIGVPDLEIWSENPQKCVYTCAYPHLLATTGRLYLPTLEASGTGVAPLPCTSHSKVKSPPPPSRPDRGTRRRRRSDHQAPPSTPEPSGGSDEDTTNDPSARHSQMDSEVAIVDDDDANWSTFQASLQFTSPSVTASGSRRSTSTSATSASSDTRAEYDRLATLLGVDSQFRDHGEGGLLVAYQKYKAYLAALQTLQNMTTAGTWPGNQPPAQDLIEIFLEQGDGAPSNKKVWGVERDVYRFSHLKTWIKHGTLVGKSDEKEEKRKGKGKEKEKDEGGSKKRTHKRNCFVIWLCMCMSICMRAPIIAWAIIMLSALPSIAAKPPPTGQASFPDIKFTVFSEFIAAHFSSKVSLATVLLVLFTMTDNPDLLNLHFRQKNPTCEGENKTEVSGWIKSLAHGLQDRLGKKTQGLFKKSEFNADSDNITTLATKLDQFAELLALTPYNDEGKTKHQAERSKTTPGTIGETEWRNGNNDAGLEGRKTTRDAKRWTETDTHARNDGDFGCNADGNYGLRLNDAKRRF